MSETGPTGTTEENVVDSTGPTGTTEENVVESTGTTGSVYENPVPATPDPNIVSIEELLGEHAVVVAKEAVDKATLQVLVNSSRDTLRTPLFAWAGLGFPPIYVVASFTVTSPGLCSDGVTRTINEYVDYCLGQSLGDVIALLQSRVTGILFSYSFAGNTLHIHASRA